MLQIVLGDTTAFSPLEAEVILFDFVKILFLIGALVYLVFAFVIVRQIQVMRSTVITPASGLIALLGFLHLAFAFGVLVFFALFL